MKWSKAAPGFLLAGLAGATACGAGDGDEQQTEAAAPKVSLPAVRPQAFQSPLPVPATLPGDVTDHEGRLWRVKKAARATGLPLEPPFRQPPTTDLYATLTDEEIANRMRMVKLVGDLEYTEVYPDVPRARLARQNNAAKKKLFVDSKDPTKTHDPDVGVTPASLNLSPLRALQSSREDKTRWHEQSWWLPGTSQSSPRPDIPRAIVGGDDRIWVDSIGQTFARPIVKLVGGDWATNYGSLGVGCTATMIGNDTAMSAAHCFYNVTAGAWNDPLAWGVDTIKWRAAGSGGAYTTQTYYPLNSYGWGSDSSPRIRV